MNKIFLITLAAALICTLFTLKTRTLKVGDSAPDFTLRDENNHLRSLSEFKGKKVVLSFYPKDESPHCTKEACNLRDSADSFAEHNIIVLGINYDSPKKHKAFKTKYNLSHILLSDKSQKVSKKYGAYTWFVDWFFPKRITILIDENQKIVQIIKSVDINNQAAQILEIFGIKE
jgi:peroxiredoxin Q/BCP